MSQYTPTTEIVRSHFSASADEYGTRDGIALTMEEAETAFDRWLAEELRQAKEAGWDEAESQDHLQGDWSDELKMTCYDDHNPYRKQP